MIVAAAPFRSAARVGTLTAVGSMTCVQLGLALSVPLFGQVGPLGAVWLRLAWAGVILPVAVRPGPGDSAAQPDHGLGVLPHLRVLPHFDKLASWAPELITRATADPPAGATAIGIDEDTALVDLAGRGRRWQVHGRQQARVLDGQSRRGFPAGSTLPT